MTRRLIASAFELVHMAGFVAAPILVLAMFASAFFANGDTVVVKLDGLCCERISRSAVKELRQLPDVFSVQTDVRSQTVTISLRKTRASVLGDAWETLARHRLKPAYMVANDMPVQR